MIADPQTERIRPPVGVIDETVYPGTVVNAGDQAPAGLAGKCEGQFQHQVVQQGIRLLSLVLFLERRRFRGQRKSFAKGETGFENIIPGERDPACDQYRVEFPVMLTRKVLGDLPFQFEVDFLVKTPDFLPDRDGDEPVFAIEVCRENGRFGQRPVRHDGAVNGDVALLGFLRKGQGDGGEKAQEEQAKDFQGHGVDPAFRSRDDGFTPPTGPFQPLLCPYVAGEGASAQVLFSGATIREWLVGVKMLRGEVSRVRDMSGL